MKKIMFNDKYGLTEAVLNGKKTQTRRVINLTDTDREYLDTAFDWDLRESVIIDRYAKYKVGEVVAVAQSYQTIFDKEGTIHNGWLCDMPLNVPGWINKMFVKAEMMPHRIRITNIRVEMLQDISEEDCLKEGIIKLYFEKYDEYGYGFRGCPLEKFLCTLRDAFLTLIDKVSGKGTWDSNPYVFVYDFELVD